MNRVERFNGLARLHALRRASFHPHFSPTLGHGGCLPLCIEMVSPRGRHDIVIECHASREEYPERSQ